MTAGRDNSPNAPQFRGPYRARVVDPEAARLSAVHDVPAEIDAEVAKVKLATMDIEIDTLTDAQESYLHSWTEGT